MPFTSHNIRLSDGSYTVSEHDGVLADREWLKSSLRTLGLIFSQNLQGKTIVDLGCLEGGYTLEFARHGMHALGVEVRQGNYENCLVVQSLGGVQNLRFVRDDVWNLRSYGLFDVVFCCGLLYHLDRPKEFVELMSDCARRAIILNTHFAPHTESQIFNLSPMTEHEGMKGRWYSEHDSDDFGEIEKFSWSSWANKRSFWLTRESILNLLRMNGFTIVFEQVDFLGMEVGASMCHGYYQKNHRGMFVGIRG